MLTLSLLALALSVLVVGGLVCGAALRVALAGPGGTVARDATRQAWQPPPIHDDELWAWAARAAHREVGQHVVPLRGARLAREMAQAIHRGMRRAIGSSPQATIARGEYACSSCRHHQLGVTPPEALSIAGALAQWPARVRRQIACRARANAQRARTLSRREFEALRIECPLLLAGHQCAANGCRPLDCQGWVCLAGRADAESSAGTAEMVLDRHARTVSRGVQAGMAEALSEHGLDAARYELNSALVVALGDPDAAERWGRGEAVFAGCRHCEE